MSKIEVKDLYVIFGSRRKQALELVKKGVSKNEVLEKTKCTVAVNNANFSIEEGEIFVVMGLSGSGKSSLIRCLNRLNTPTSGSIFVNGKDVTRMTEEQLRQLRRTEMSMVFQHFGLLPHRTVLSNTAFGLEIQGKSEEESLEKARQMIKTVGLEGYEDMMTRELSGGMQQRVGLARALTTDPQILLMDEAFSALDPLIRTNMQDELIELQRKLKKTIVFITHDLDEALKLGDRIAIMKDGEIVQIGTPEEILVKPADDYVRAFVENVDRSKIVTASSLMFKDTGKLIIEKDGPALALRRMREMGVNRLPVVDRENKFLGFVMDHDVVELKKKDDRDMRKILISDVMPKVSPDTPAADLLPLFIDKQLPLPVVDEEDRLLGVAVHSSVIAEVTGRDREEIIEIKNSGGL
ncbi:MAG: gbuA [Anaerophaga sp.]|uniref:quaternary amine ABC transporter ATP-binding protein n=1 Tax=Anaerophaga thermohalophila TaxID=177400 RepID=UPI000237BA93|nr:glycine betaine/L-proline ABC transporter ATP-binding protein [Anaerophaga thermohalophila]MBZ4675479.1 gbuA [Anaerophaga sp.]MDK2841388.1 glycine betaine/proline transport system ATP-binding protein [Anaerophaga sp.]MDN5291451.1 glycine betaine/proline transport system ATP-binding protein [Anaerophaga sp.]